MAGIFPPFPDIPIIQEDGRVTEQWRSFFYELWLRTGGLQEEQLFAEGGILGTGTEADPFRLDLDFPANVDHTGVAIVAGIGLAGGGTIDESRQLDLDFLELPEDTTPIQQRYYLAAHRSNGPIQRIRLDRLLAGAGLQDHLDDFDNPHNVTALQVSYSGSSVQDALDELFAGGSVAAARNVLLVEGDEFGGPHNKLLLEGDAQDGEFCGLLLTGEHC